MKVGLFVPCYVDQLCPQVAIATLRVLEHGAECITSTDMSCLMHLDGLIRRQQLDIRVLHVAETLNAGAR